jgi:hypothetical protein
VTISGNTAAANVGGVAVYGGTLIDSIVTDNHAATTGGVQIHSGTISHTVIRDNVATGSIGGVFLSGEGQIDHSEISGNSAGADGGGVALAVKTPTITNSTISGNTAARGGGIFREPVDPVEPDPGTATLSFVTIADNTAGTGANVFGDNSNGVIHAGRSIIAYSHSGSDCNIALVSDDYNVEEGTSCMLNSANDVSGVDPLLGALANNGGPTKTRSLGANSPAVNRVPAQACPSSDDDQRGTSRPVGGACDSGAFESSFSSTATPSPSPSPTGSPVSQQKVWGDEDCGNDVDGADLAELLRWAAGIPLLTQGCFPALNAAVYVNSVALRWADLNCDTVVNAVDALTHVLVKAGLTPTLVGNGCPNLEDQVSVHD